MIRFQALGGLAVTDGGEELNLGGSRQRRLLAVLLIHRNAVVSVDRLVEAVFAGEPTAAASTTLRSYIARIRRVVDRPGSASMVLTQAPGYALRVPGDALDVAAFESLVGEAGARLSRGDAAGASSELREALALWRGEAYAEFAGEEWALPEAQRLAELRLVAQERLVDAELACGRAAELIPEIEALAREQPLRESFRAQLMTACYRTGRQADALRVFGDYREVLVGELGLEPSPALVELERLVLTHDPTLLLDEPAGRPLRGYRLGERLGTGRDGTVFAARLPGVDRDFAIRVFREDIADSPAFVRSFEATVHRVASLHHPAIVPIHDYWREPGAAYLVMRRMHGGTLADRLGRGPLTATAAVAVVRRVGAALTAAADAGVVHGRVSPENVLFDAGGEPYLGDFAVGPLDRRGRDDVQDFARLAQVCLATHSGPAGGVIAEALRPEDRQSMSHLVAALTAAVAGEGAADEGGGPPNPYKGLRAFDEPDAADFFGRDDVVTDLLDRLSDQGLRGRLALVVGGSGTGKSSVVRAGVLPRVRRGDVPGSSQWLVTTMVPGSSPFKELAESLRHVAVGETSGLEHELAQDCGVDRVVRRLVPEGADLLLVIDQFEELFTLASEPVQRGFLRALMHAVAAPDSRVRVVATLRADFYDRPLAVQPFGGAVSDATVTIPAMLPAGLEAAIVEPAERVGGRVERALVAELVSAVVDQPGALPALQFALYELAERSPARRLTMAAYRELGGIDGAIASRAEALYSTVDDRERAAVRGMFEHLVAVSADGEPTRRRAARTELSGTAAEPVDDVIDRWANARLLTLDRHPQTRVPTVEVAHEALLREWPRLRSWIDEHRDVLMVRGRLREAADSWGELGRDPGALYRGARLDVALDATNGRFGQLPTLEREFLVASQEERDREQREASERVARQTRANRRLRTQLAVIGIALIVALVGGFVAVDQRRQAQQERGRATVRELASAAEANIADDPERSMLLALAAVDEARSSGGAVLPEAVEALHHAVTASRVVLTVPGVGGDLDWSPDGTMFVTEGPEESGRIDIRDATTGESVRAFDGHDVDVNGVAFSGVGTRLATTGDDGAARVWDPTTGELLMEHQDSRYGAKPGSSLTVRGPSFGPGGDLVAASFLDIVRVIDVATGAVVQTIPAEAGASATAFSPDGKRIAFGLFDGGALGRIVDIGSGREVAALGEGESAATLDVAWSPDGRSIATVGDGVLRLWNAETGELRFTGSSHTAEVNSVDWSPEGDQLATVSDDGSAVVWEITDGGLREVHVFAARGRSQSLIGVAFSPDGTRLMAGDTAITAVTVWDVTTSGGAEWLNRPVNSEVEFTTSGQIVHLGPDGTVHVSDAATGRRLRDLAVGDDEDPSEIGLVDVSGDGSMLAVARLDSVDAWEVDTGEHRFSHPLEAGIAELDWSDDGEHLAVASYDTGEIVVLDRTGDVVSTFHEKPGQRVVSVSFSPDGRRVATTREGSERVVPTDMPVTIWDWKSGEVVNTIDAAASLVAFAPSGGTIATSRRVESIVDIWEESTGDLRTTIVAPVPVTALAFSPDGTTIATGHADGTIRVWDAASGVQQLSLVGGEAGVYFLAFSPDGAKLAATSAEGLVRVWALDVDDLVAIATGRLTRGFTEGECRQYLHVARCPAP